MNERLLAIRYYRLDEETQEINETLITEEIIDSLKIAEIVKQETFYWLTELEGKPEYEPFVFYLDV